MGVPVHDDHVLFEFLTLEGAPGGAELVDHPDEARALPACVYGFDPSAVARFTTVRIDRILADAGVVRHRGKIESTVSNAKVFLVVQDEFGTFDRHVWEFVVGAPRVNRRRALGEIPSSTPESDALSKDLKGRGFLFVGSTICYAFMQAVGMVNDHVIDCFRYTDFGGERVNRRAPAWY
jgi:DNA-3-methyladenine glycosylase I